MTMGRRALMEIAAIAGYTLIFRLLIYFTRYP